MFWSNGKEQNHGADTIYFKSYLHPKKNNSFVSWFGGKDRNHHGVDSMILKSDRILKK
jgi:hypothetical protein